VLGCKSSRLAKLSRFFPYSRGRPRCPVVGVGRSNSFASRLRRLKPSPGSDRVVTAISEYTTSGSGHFPRAERTTAWSRPLPRGGVVSAAAWSVWVRPTSAGTWPARAAVDFGRPVDRLLATVPWAHAHGYMLASLRDSEMLPPVPAFGVSRPEPAASALRLRGIDCIGQRLLLRHTLKLRP